jgi:epoxyqueuosine reductase
MIAVGNSGDHALAGAARSNLGDPSPLVRGAAVWALSRLLPLNEFTALATDHAAKEPDATVCAEWTMAE